MKYFTTDLLLRFGSEDPDVSDAAHEQWEQACERYNAYLATIKAEMSPGLRQIEDSYYLHDARVRGMGKQGSSFVIILQLDTPPHSLLTFTFDLIDEPAIDTAALPRELCSTGEIVEWQYDELELGGGESPTWFWTILLSNGWAVCLHFRDVKVQEAQALLPAPRNGAGAMAPPVVPQSV